MRNVLGIALVVAVFVPSMCITAAQNKLTNDRVRASVILQAR